MQTNDMQPTTNTENVFLTHAQIAEVFGVTRARIFQIECQAIRKLRAAIKAEAAACGKTVREWLAESFVTQ